MPTVACQVRMELPNPRGIVGPSTSTHTTVPRGPGQPNQPLVLVDDSKRRTESCPISSIILINRRQIDDGALISVSSSFSARLASVSASASGAISQLQASLQSAQGSIVTLQRSVAEAGQSANTNSKGANAAVNANTVTVTQTFVRTEAQVLVQTDFQTNEETVVETDAQILVQTLVETALMTVTKSDDLPIVETVTAVHTGPVFIETFTAGGEVVTETVPILAMPSSEAEPVNSSTSSIGASKVTSEPQVALDLRPMCTPAGTALAVLGIVLGMMGLASLVALVVLWHWRRRGNSKAGMSRVRDSKESPKAKHGISLPSVQEQVIYIANKLGFRDSPVAGKPQISWPTSRSTASWQNKKSTATASQPKEEEFRISNLQPTGQAFTSWPVSAGNKGEETMPDLPGLLSIEAGSNTSDMTPLHELRSPSIATAILYSPRPRTPVREPDWQKSKTKVMIGRPRTFQRAELSENVIRQGHLALFPEAPKAADYRYGGIDVQDGRDSIAVVSYRERLDKAARPKFRAFPSTTKHPPQAPLPQPPVR